METEPIDVTCHRCGNEFATWASKRTTCRVCRAAVTVRRAEHCIPASGEIPVDASALGWPAAIILMGVIAWWLWKR